MNKTGQNSSNTQCLGSSFSTPRTEVIDKFKVLPAPTKSPNDTKDYRVIRLENGLTVCLISDLAKCKDHENLLVDSEESSSEESGTESESSEEESSEAQTETSDDEDKIPSRRNLEEEVKLAAAALCIGVGSFSDPKEVPGMAHFLEHMVFMGSEKFPQENDFDAFIKKHGGSDNAQTEFETTTFYFECFEKHLLQGLDKFAQFFISPLMKRESMTRERKAVESEFQLAMPSDEYRRDQLLVSFTQKDSPVNTFAWGNLITLEENIEDDVLYECLHKFRKRHYSAHRMTLALQARLPLDILQDYVLQCFSNIPNNGLAPDDFKNYNQEVFNTPQFNKLYYIKPVKDICQVDLTWVLPSLLHMYKVKPHAYVSWLLGHEGKGSLLSYLKRKVWALSLHAGNGESDSEHNGIYATFSVSIVLTQEGHSHIKEVIEAIFSYLKLLTATGPQERIFREMQLIEDTLFRFQEEEDAVDIVEDLSQAMQYYPSEDYLTGSELLYNFDAEAISMVLKHLTPERVNIMISSSLLPKDLVFDQIEPWFQTNYTVTNIPEDWIKGWKNVGPYPELKLPEPNRFLTEDFSLLNGIDVPDHPELILKSPSVELWYKGDKKFELPNAYYYYYLISPLSLDTAVNACMLNMLAVFLAMELSEEGYPAQIAELDYAFTCGERGLLMKIHGYNEKLPMVVELIASYTRTVGKNLNVEVFEAVKEKQMKAYYNKLLKPSQLCKDLRLSILQNQYYSLLDKYLAIPAVNFEMMKEYMNKFFKNLYVMGLVQGNVSKEVAVNTTNKLIEQIGCNHVDVVHLPKLLTRQIPLGERCCRVSSFNQSSPNSITTNYYQCDPLTIKDNVILEFVMLLIEEPMFDILRTKEQLGYSVYPTVRDTCGILGYSITVNSQIDKFSTGHVDDRIEAFVNHTQKMLKKLHDRKFEHTKQDLLKLKKCIDIDLEEEVVRNWEEIVDQRYVFDRRMQESRAIEDLKVNEIRKWWYDYNASSAKCRKLSVQVEGHMRKSNDQEIELTQSADGEVKLQFLSNAKEIEERSKKQDYFISDIDEFKKDLYLYPDQTKVGITEIKANKC